MYASLAYGNLSAWTYWQGSEKDGYTEYSLMAGAAKPGKNYYVSKQFYRFIRPGAQRVDLKSSDAEVMAVAFQHPTMNAFTIVAINTGSASKSLHLAGAELPADFRAFRTSAKEDAVDLGTVAADGLTLSASSITTFVHGSYREDQTGSGAGGTGGTGGTGGGAAGTGGMMGSGGAKNDGGVAGAAGRSGPGGVAGAAGRSGPGGVAGAAGRSGPGGVAGAAGRSGPGGVAGAGGSPGTAGDFPSGSEIGTGGRASAGGAPGTGGVNGVAGTGGVKGIEGTSANAAGARPGEQAPTRLGCSIGARSGATSAFWAVAWAGLTAALASRSRRRTSRRSPHEPEAAALPPACSRLAHMGLGESGDRSDHGQHG